MPKFGRGRAISDARLFKPSGLPFLGLIPRGHIWGQISIFYFCANILPNMENRDLTPRGEHTSRSSVYSADLAQHPQHQHPQHTSTLGTLSTFHSNIPRTMKGVRWWMISLLMLGAIINYLTRSTLAVAAPTVLKDLAITTQQYSWILGAFQGAIMLQPLCGYVLDVIGLKFGFALFALAWSFISMAHGAGAQLDGAVLAARPARACRRIGESRRHEGDVGMVSGAASAASPAASSTSAPRSGRCSRRRSWPGRS